MKTTNNTPHPDLLEAQELAYKPAGLTCVNIKKECESQEYGASSFSISNKHVIFRTTKITPTKTGQFVTLWKRIGSGPIQPYDFIDPIDLFVISIRTTEHFGQFVFPKPVLYKHGIIAKDGKGGRRAMRVYAPWDIATSAQAKQTKAWQSEYFFEITHNLYSDKKAIKRIQGLYGITL